MLVWSFKINNKFFISIRGNVSIYRFSYSSFQPCVFVIFIRNCVKYPFKLDWSSLHLCENALMICTILSKLFSNICSLLKSTLHFPHFRKAFLKNIKCIKVFATKRWLYLLEILTHYLKKTYYRVPLVNIRYKNIVVVRTLYIYFGLMVRYGWWWNVANNFSTGHTLYWYTKYNKTQYLP